MATRDSEVRKVTADLDALLDRLAANVEALSAILTRPPQHPPESEERLVPQ